MKKTLLLVCLIFTTGITAFAQNIINPVVERTDDYNCYISKIETTKDFTIVTFDYTAPSDNAWAQINKEIFIRTDLSDKRYAFVKAEDITIAPEKQYLDHAGDKLTFKAYFQKIPKNAKLIDVIEREGGNTNESSYFNYYNVSLTKSQGKYVTRVDIAPPPASNTSTFSVNSDMANVFNNMGPMFSTMTRSMMDAQLKYYKQPGKIAEIAKLQKEYFDALVEEGFTTDQALKIITSDSLLPKASVSGK